MLLGLDLVKLSLPSDSSLPRWVLPGFDLNKLWPTRGDKNSTLVPFLGGTISFKGSKDPGGVDLTLAIISELLREALIIFLTPRLFP